MKSKVYLLRVFCAIAGVQAAAPTAHAYTSIVLDCYVSGSVGFSAPCRRLVVGDPIGIEGTTNRNPPPLLGGKAGPISAFVEADGISKAGSVGVSSIATLVPRLAVGSYEAASIAQAFSTDSFQVVASSGSHLALGALVNVKLSGLVDFVYSSIWPSNIPGEFFSSYDLLVDWGVNIKSLDSLGRTVSTTQMGDIIQASSAVDGSFSGLGTSFDTKIFLGSIGGSIQLDSYLKTIADIVAADSGSRLNSLMIDARVDAGHTLHVYLDTPSNSVSLLSSTGHDYSSPLSVVPEPTAIGMFSLGLCLMGLLHNIRRKRGA